MASSSLHLIPPRSSKPSPPNPATRSKPKKAIIAQSQTTPSPLIPTMAEIMESSRGQKLRLQLQTLGPLFRVKALRLEEEEGLELGRAEGLIRPWPGGKVLHLDSIRMRKETLGLDRSIFGLGLFVGAVAVRHGFDCGCLRAELLAINDSLLYHSKLVRFYTRIGFKAVREVDGSSLGDLPHMLVWGGKGTRMDANIEELLMKWSTRFKSPS